MELSMWRLMSAIIAVVAATLITATATEAAPVNGAASVRTQVNEGLVGGENTLVPPAPLAPPGFRHPRQVRWHGRPPPPGWGRPRKVGLHPPAMPPTFRPYQPP